MPIFKRTPQYDPSVDSYPGAQQALNAAFGLAGIAQNQQSLQQGQQRIDLATKGQDADIAQAKERMSLWQQDADLRRQEFEQRRAAIEDAAHVGFLGLQRDVQETPETDDDEQFAEIEKAAGSIKSPEGRALYFQDVQADLNEKRIGKSLNSLTESMGNSMRNWAQSPFPELNEMFGKRAELLAKEMEAFADPKLDPRIRAQGIDQARDAFGQLQNQFAKEVDRKLKEQADMQYVEMAMGQMPANSPGGRLLSKAFAEASSGRATWAAAARAAANVPIGNTVNVKATDPETGDAIELWLSPEEASERFLKIERERARQAEAAARIQAQGGRGTTTGRSDKTLLDLIDRVLGVDESGEMEVTGPDGKKTYRRPTKQELQAAGDEAKAMIEGWMRQPGGGMAPMQAPPAPVAPQQAAPDAPPPGLGKDEFMRWFEQGK